MKNIITKNINGLQFNELKSTMQRMIEESIATLACNGGYNDKDYYLDHLSWYKDCKIEDYFRGGFEEIFDADGNKVGEGINTIAHSFVLNDDTRADFESAFEQARDDAYEARLKEIAEEIKNIDDDEIEYIEIDDTLNEEEIDDIERGCCSKGEVLENRVSEACEMIEKKGGVRIAIDNDTLLEFNNDILDEIYDIVGQAFIRQIAIWSGANVCVHYQGAEYFDYEYDFYKIEKKIETDLDNMTVHAYGYDENDNAEVEIEMQKQVDKDTEDDDCAYEVMGADFVDGVWRAKLIEHDKCDETLFHILMGMDKDDFKKQEELFDFEVEVAFEKKVRGFDARAFRDVSFCTTDILDFLETAEIGQSAYIDGVTYYKVRDCVTDEPYAVYFDDDDMRIL